MAIRKSIYNRGLTSGSIDRRRLVRAATTGNIFNINYDLSDTEDTATVTFYYDTNADMAGGTQITGACTGAAEGTGVNCAWDTGTVTPTPGDYYIYGVADDGVNVVVAQPRNHRGRTDRHHP